MPKRRVKRHSVTQPLDKPYRFIALTQGQNAIVDAEDFEWLDQWIWYAHWNPITKSFYALRCRDRNIVVSMQREIMHDIDGLVDHKNHDTLDNRKKNLRKVTCAQNKMNARVHKNSFSGYKGVAFDKRIKRWEAYIKISKKRRHLGNFGDPKKAAMAYDAAAREHFGEFAHTNFP